MPDENDTGNLFFNADGVGGAAGIRFATLGAASYSPISSLSSSAALANAAGA
jgi:hypothetical protein